ncbi:DUF202 domain-containing protein [Streptomyces sp. NPDC088725]|uniref:DUF202 domain-containing protein n=1 Tax=Streptomyces sp. NPDC088725 TaxID=3365873 RepID=UPI00382CB949
MTPPPRPPRDPGLQPERTRLAWRRTTLSCTVTAVLAVRQATRHGGTAGGLTAAALSALVWLGFLAVAHRRMVTLSTAAPDPLPPRPLPVQAAIATAVCTVCLTVFAATALW